MLVRYAQLHTLDDEGTTVPDRLHDLVATGAGAYAALEWASFATNRVNVGGAETWRNYHTWAQERMAAFAKALAKLGRERRLRAHRPLSAGDRRLTSSDRGAVSAFRGRSSFDRLRTTLRQAQGERVRIPLP